MSLVIFDKYPKFRIFSKESVKIAARYLLKKKRGPQSVVESLLRGLQENSFDYKYNPNYKDIKKDDVVYVTGSIDALKFLIKLKKVGKFSKLIAGPTLVLTPEDYGGLIKDKNIDIYLVPSDWVRDFYASLGDNSFSNRLKVWPAGVAIPVEMKNDGIHAPCILYKKDVDQDVLNKVLEVLKQKNIQFKMIEYGKYKRDEYFSLLGKANFMIYLQRIESQGVALFEAWARNIPTMVWNCNSFIYKGINREVRGNISAPYLSKECGVYFGINDFNSQIDLFTSNLRQFNPRDYIEKNFSDKICAKKFLDLIK